MRSIKIKHPRVVAFILLAFELFLILYCSYGVAENHSRYSAAVEIDTSDMYLTFKEDTTFEENNETITIPKGTVIRPETILFRARMIRFFYSTEGLSVEECKQVDSSERKEKGIYYFHAEPEPFEECEELKRLWNEAEKEVNDKRRTVIIKLLIPVVCFCIVWLVVWGIFSWKKKTVVLYVMDIIMMPIFLLISLFLFNN